MANNYTSIICGKQLARLTRTMDKHKCSSASTTAVGMEAAEECANCSERLSTARFSTRNQK